MSEQRASVQQESGGEQPVRQVWWRRVVNIFDQAWLNADPRALGIFRICLGLLSMYDVIRRVPYLDTFYSNEGVLSNHFTLFSAPYKYSFSALYMCSTPAEAGLFFAFSLICLACFTVGYRTTLFHLLSMACIISIHARNTLLENGGDVVLNIWWVWTFFLPLGARFSVDALRKSLSDGADRSPPQLKSSTTGSTSAIRSLAVFMVLWQLVVIYLFNTLHKSGQTWMDGTAIALTLYQDRINTPLTIWFRDGFPLIVSQIMTWGTLVIEGMAPVLLLTPIFTKWARRVAFLSLTSLHLGILLLTDVGLFSPVMIVAYLIFLHPDDISLIKSSLRRLAGPPIRVWYDDGCGVCFRLARIGSRLDRLELVQWHGSSTSVERPRELDEERFAEVTQRSILVECQASGERYEDGLAVARIACALPILRLVAWVAWVPGIRQMLDGAYRALAARRHRISEWLGYGVCQLAPVQLSGDDAAPEQPMALFWRRARVTVGTVVMLTIFAATTSQLIMENRWIKRQGVKINQPEWAKAVVQYGRIFQGWSMFAPNAPDRDGWIIIDVELPDGTRIDPQTGRAPVFIPATYPIMKWDQFWGSYSMRIAAGRNRRHRPGLIHWLRNTKVDRLELKAGQRVKSVVVWWIGDESPDPRVGGPPKEIERYVVTEWPKGTSKKRSE